MFPRGSRLINYWLFNALYTNIICIGTQTFLAKSSISFDNSFDSYKHLRHLQLALRCTISCLGEKGRIRVWFIVKNTRFYTKFSHVLLPQTVYFWCDRKTGALRFCAHSNFWLLSFNNPEYRCFSDETPLSSISEPFAPTRLGVTNQYFTYIRGYLHCTHQCWH